MKQHLPIWTHEWLGVALPLLRITLIVLAAWLLRTLAVRLIRRITARYPDLPAEVALSARKLATFLISAAAAALILPLLNHVNAFTFGVIVVLMALITGCMHSANHIFITRIPGVFQKAGRVSGIVGILNAITYVGGALSPYAIAYIAGESGWNTAVLFWMVLAALSTLLCAAVHRKWSAFKRSL